jgi:hypothetical protein
MAGEYYTPWTLPPRHSRRSGRRSWGFVSETPPPRLSELRVQLLGQCSYVNTITWTITIIRHHTSYAEHGPRSTPSPTHRNVGCTSCLDLPGMRGILFLPSGWTFTFPSTPPPTPTLLQWTPKYQPKKWVYTNGFDIKGQSRFGETVVHVPTCKTIYIDARGTEETRIIMRAELVAIYAAPDKFATHE